jgi:FMN-dependent oxidoreductase (nitrilotriacetate monooxygenase family)
MTDARKMVLVAFLQAQNCSNYPASWRHPASMTDFTSAEYYQRIARTLEGGKFQLAFFDDRLAMPASYNGSFIESVRNGIRVVKLDAVTVLTVMGCATERLGLGATYSTTYYEPFHVARVFATLDNLFHGRAAWNIVTSLNDAEAANFGREEHLSHDLRYDRAEEFMEIVTGHWDSWEDGAIVLDKQLGVFADPAKVHQLDARGTYLRSRGPFTVPRSEQGRPVLMQAGQSGRGREFAGKWADLVFTIFPNLAAGRRGYATFKDSLVAAGRDPSSVKVTPAVYVVPGETHTMAEEKMAFIESLAKPIDALELLSEVLNFDFASKPYDAAFTQGELDAMTGLRAVIDRVVEQSGSKNPTVADFVKFSARGTVHEFPTFVGTAGEIADQMEQWLVEPACDGFVICATHLPGAYEDFVRLVVPELQRRGLFWDDYAGPTLRENLGLQPYLSATDLGAPFAGRRLSGCR